MERAATVTGPAASRPDSYAVRGRDNWSSMTGLQTVADETGRKAVLGGRRPTWLVADRKDEAVGTIGTVVVGVDGSEGSRAALRYALEEAAIREARVQVVTAVRAPDYFPTYGMPIPPPTEEIVADARAGAQREVDQVVAERDPADTSPPIGVQAVAGSPAAVLLGVARNADLLVLGHRGHGAFSSALLGSVGLQCVLHATCPVTIVRPTPSESSSTLADAAAATRRTDRR